MPPRAFYQPRIQGWHTAPRAPLPSCGKCVSCGLRHNRLPLTVAGDTHCRKLLWACPSHPTTYFCGTQERCCRCVRGHKPCPQHFRIHTCSCDQQYLSPFETHWYHVLPQALVYRNATSFVLTNPLVQSSSPIARSPSPSRQEFPTQLVCHLHCLVGWSDSWHTHGRASSGKASWFQLHDFGPPPTLAALQTKNPTRSQFIHF